MVATRLVRKGKPLTKEQRAHAQQVFITTFAGSGNLTVAAKAAGVSRETIYTWREHDEDFSLRFNQAEAEAADVIRAAIFQRAVHGVKKYVVSAGRVVYLDGKPLQEQEYSDNLLVHLAKARCPEFKDDIKITGSIEHSMVPDGPARMLAQQLLDAVVNFPAAREALSIRLLASGE